MHPLLRLGEESEFWNFEFLGEVKIYLILGGCPMRGLYFLGGGQFVLHPFSHFEMEDFKNSKLIACSALIFNIHIFRFKIDAGLQVDVDFTLNLNFLVQGAVSCYPLMGTQNQPKP